MPTSARLRAEIASKFVSRDRVPAPGEVRLYAGLWDRTRSIKGMSILLAVLGISVLVIVHEAGHYFAARAFGMRVLRFSIGFGPTIAKFQPQGSSTIFQVGLIPFLAYVQIAGMNPAEENDPDDPVSAGERYASIYEINMLRCIFCGFCEEACPTGAVVLGHEFELADYRYQDFVYGKEDMLVGVRGRPRRRGCSRCTSRARCRGAAAGGGGRGSAARCAPARPGRRRSPAS
jgi:ferredoxin